MALLLVLSVPPLAFACAKDAPPATAPEQRVATSTADVNVAAASVETTSPLVSAPEAGPPTPDAVVASAPARADDGGGGGAQLTQPSLVHDETPFVHGSLPPEVIQRIVRQHFDAIRACYLAGLKKNAHLAGTVKVAFEIDANGVAEAPKSAGSSLPDAGVIACVVGLFNPLLHFPQPQGGTVHVVYPLVFTPN